MDVAPAFPSALNKTFNPPATVIQTIMAAPALPDQRVGFGIPKLDDALTGGIPKNNVVLVSGGAGTGKSTLCLHFALEGIRQGERVLYVSTEQDQDELAHQARFEPNFDDWVKQYKLRVLHLDINAETTFLQRIHDEIAACQPSRIVVDSLSTFSEFAGVTDFARQLLLQRPASSHTAQEVMPTSLSEKTISKKMLDALVSKLKRTGATVLVTSELPEKGDTLSSDGITEFLADGVLLMRYMQIGESASRTLTIRKMRYTSHREDSLRYKLTPRGFEVHDEVVI